MKFTYYDNSKQTWEKVPDGNGHFVSEVVCVIVADSITLADKQYQAKTGKDPSKQPHIAVTCEK